MARQANGQPWEMDGTEKNISAELFRVPFFPDGARLFEEIDRLGISDEGVGCLLTAKADFDFYRALPSGGYAKGRRESERTDVGEGDIPPEIRGKDFFPYRPGYLAQRTADGGTGPTYQCGATSFEQRQISRRHLARRQSIRRRDHLLA